MSNFITSPEDLVNLARQSEPNLLKYQQAVERFASAVVPYALEHPSVDAIQDYIVLQRMISPDKVFQFSVPWMDASGVSQLNKGYRVQFSNKAGVYKGGLRFHPEVDLDTMMFLAFDQVWKNVPLDMGGAKGGANFDHRGKSEKDVMLFCYAFMEVLHENLKFFQDIPAGDIGVGPREVGFMYSKMLKLNGRNGNITGKGPLWEGITIREQATGYGLIQFMHFMLKGMKNKLSGLRCLVSGSGNVARHAAEKAMEMGAIVLTLSDTGGFVFAPNGLTKDHLRCIKELKKVRGTRLADCAEKFTDLEYYEDQKPWNVPGSLILPCASQNELDKEDARVIVSNGCIAVGEGANMPLTKEAHDVFCDAGIPIAPDIVANSGGVVASKFEMKANGSGKDMYELTQEDLDFKLSRAMKLAYSKCVEYGKEKDGRINYEKGAFINAFESQLQKMLAFGLM